MSEVEPGFFLGFGGMETFHCDECELGPALLNGSFAFRGNSPYLLLVNNGISSLEPGAISGMRKVKSRRVQTNHILPVLPIHQVISDAV